MRKIILLLMLSLLLMAGTYKKSVHLSFGSVLVDSVRAWVQVDSFRVDSALWLAFPIDSAIDITDTAEQTISWWVYFTLDTGLYKSATEYLSEPVEPVGIYDLQVVVVNTTPSPDDSLSGVAVEIENSGGHKYPAKVTDDSGMVLFTVGDGIWTIRTYTPLATGDTSRIDMAASDQQVIHDVTTGGLPAAAATSDWVMAYADLTQGGIDTTTGLYIGATDMTVKLHLVNAGHFTNNNFIILPKIFEATPNDSGRVRFVLPANTKLSPPGSYYEMYFIGYGGITLGGGMIKRFIVDTLPDPLDISAAASVR